MLKCISNITKISVFDAINTGQIAQESCYKGKYSIIGVTSGLVQLLVFHYFIFTTAGGVPASLPTSKVHSNTQCIAIGPSWL